MRTEIEKLIHKSNRLIVEIQAKRIPSSDDAAKIAELKGFVKGLKKGLELIEKERTSRTLFDSVQSQNSEQTGS